MHLANRPLAATGNAIGWARLGSALVHGADASTADSPNAHALSLSPGNVYDLRYPLNPSTC
jgi:hypothetical protein